MKTIILKGALLAVMLFAAELGYAQGYNGMNSGNASVIRAKESRANLVGDPYLYPIYKKAYVKFGSGSTNSAVYEVKYDQLEDMLAVKGAGTEEYSFNDPVVEFKFQDENRIFRSGFAPVGKAVEKSFYEVVYDGKTKFLKRDAKVIIEGKEYNSATITKKVESDVAYYIVKPDGKPVAVKANEKSIVAELGKPELSKYIKENKLNLKDNADLVKLFTYYDSL